MQRNAPQPVPGLHQGSAAGEDIEQMIDRHSCSELYYRLEECLGEHDRDWRKCQAEVKSLKTCNDALAAARRAQLEQQERIQRQERRDSS